MSEQLIHSTGRGGAGNIGPDPNVYADGAIVHEGYHGESAAPEYSSGRGGAGNIVNSPRHDPQTTTVRTDRDVVPELALRQQQQENFHTGRGGGGNVHKDKYGGHSQDSNKGSLGDKIKNLVHPQKKEDKPTGSA